MRFLSCALCLCDCAKKTAASRFGELSVCLACLHILHTCDSVPMRRCVFCIIFLFVLSLLAVLSGMCCVAAAFCLCLFFRLRCSLDVCFILHCLVFCVLAICPCLVCVPWSLFLISDCVLLRRMLRVLGLCLLAVSWEDDCGCMSIQVFDVLCAGALVIPDAVITHVCDVVSFMPLLC